MKNSISYLLVLICFSTYYILLSYLFIDRGFFNLEHFFSTNQIYALFSEDTNQLEVFYFTTPLLQQISIMIFSFFDAFVAPIITSIIFISCLASFVVNKLMRSNKKILSFFVALYFLSSPTFIYAAISGGPLALYIALFFVIFYFLFRYAFDSTSYNLIIVSLALSLFVFLNFQYLYAILFLIPLFFFYSIYTTIGIKREFVSIFNKIIESYSQQRKLISRFFSIFLIVAFTPIITLLLYLVINNWYGNDYFYFNGVNAIKWNKHSLSEFYFFDVSASAINYSLSKTKYLINVLLLSPLLVGLFYLIRKKLLLVYTLGFAFIFLLFSYTVFSSSIINLKVFCVSVAAALATLVIITTLLFRKKQTIKKILPLIIISILVQLAGEWTYFKTTNDLNESTFANAFFQQYNHPVWIKSQYDMAGYIQENITPDKVILMDSSILYPCLAFVRNEVKVLDRFNNRYSLALQNPKNVDYFIVSKPGTFYHPKDDLRHLIKQQYLTELQVEIDVVHYNEHFTLFKIRKE